MKGETMKYILWDWNGTLFDDFEICRRTIDKLLENHGVKPLKTAEKYREVFQFPVTEFYKNAGLDFEKTPFEVLAKEYMDMYIPLSEDKTQCKLNENAVFILQTLKERGFSQEILSASKIDTLKKQVESFGIEKYFDNIMGINDIYARSKAEIAREWKETRHIPAENIVFIGDSMHDLEIAEILGCRCLLFGGGHQYIPEKSDRYEKINYLTEVAEKV